jgi:hypothetical protein
MSTLVGTPVVAPVKAVRAVRSTRVNAAVGKAKPAKKTVAKAKAKVCFSPVFSSTWQLVSSRGPRAPRRETQGASTTARVRPGDRANGSSPRVARVHNHAGRRSRS